MPAPTTKKPERTKAPSVIRWVEGHSWAIREEALRQIHEIASRENSPEAFQAFMGQPLQNTETVEMRDGIAILPVDGPVFPRANLFTMFSGATSIELLARDFNQALMNKDVKAIVLNINSPGGEVTGVSEFADMIYQARGKKPITAYVYGMGASAAYWIASAADRIVVADTAEIGSIGVISVFRDESAKNEKAGVKDIMVVSSASPLKGAGPNTPDGLAKQQRIVDDLAEVFYGTVARNRGVSVETVKNEFGRGDLFIGQRAVDQGMAEAVGSLESVIASLQSKPKFQKIGGMRMDEEMKALQESNPKLFEAISKQAAAQAATKATEDAKKESAKETDAAVAAELERVKSIETLLGYGADEVVHANKFAVGMTKDKMATMILEANKKTAEENKGKLHPVAADGKALATQLASVKTGTENGATEETKRAKTVTSLAASMNSIRK